MFFFLKYVNKLYFLISLKKYNKTYEKIIILDSDIKETPTR